jgi:tetratricopeptide (TPR) repeat protein
VEHRGQTSGSRSFGGYLRRVREGRKLSLDAVEEMSLGFPERLTKSHLSRIETGQAIPTFPKLFALSRIYGVPVASMAERFDLELQREMVPADVSEKSDEEVQGEVLERMRAGNYVEALTLCVAILDRMGEPRSDPRSVKNFLNCKLYAIDCLIKLDRFEMAKGECEELLGHAGLNVEQRLLSLYYFVICCYRLRRFTVAMMALDSLEKQLDAPGAPPRLRADLVVTRASVMRATGFLKEAVAGFARAADLYEKLQDPFETCRAWANLGIVLQEDGQIDEARERLQSALKVAEASGYDRLRAIALSNLAVLDYHSGDMAGAEAHALRSNVIARPREYLSVIFRNCFYLWKVSLSKGDEAGAKLNERTLRIYLSRLEDDLPEAKAYRAYLAGGVR